jgi:peptide/nickel transport system substrate-binding protein
MMKKVALLATLATVGALVAGCGDSGSTTKNESSNTFTTINEDHGITVGAPMNPYNTNGNTFLGYDTMQLAWNKKNATNYNDFFPGLAKSWTISDDGTKVKIVLQPNAKWSNGKPVTADDVKTSMAVAFTQGNAQAFYLGSVKVISPTEVEFTQIPGSKYKLFFEHLMQTIIVPSFEYDSQMPSNIWDIIQTSLYSGNDKSKQAAAAKAQDQLLEIGKKIANYAPKEDISAGPFVLKKLSPGEALLEKNPNYFNADKVKIDKVVFRNYTGNEQIWNYLIGGQLDACPFTAMPQNIEDKILKTKGTVKLENPSYVAAALAFNQSKAPYDKLEVRQALAYVIDRGAVQKIAEPAVGTVAKYSDGMIDSATEQWLTPDQIRQLNPYNHDLDKATKLLESVGFKKVDGKWMMPDGKPWTATIYTVNGFNDWIQAAKVISTEMTEFGIPTQPSIVNSYSEYLKNLADGDYALGFWLNALGPAAYNTYQRVFGEPDGYNIVAGKLVHYSASDKGKGNWLNIPETVKLPDGSTINPGELTNQLNSLDVPEQKPIVQKLALATNANLPMITLWDYINVQFVNTTRFTNFPKDGDAAVLSNPPGVWIQLGYVQPQSSK